MKIIFWILLILFVISVVGAAVVAATNLLEARDLRAANADLKQQLRDTNQELQRVNMKYRGFMESLKEVPDSLRFGRMTIVKSKDGEYRQKIHDLEKQERDHQRFIRKNDREIAAVVANLKRRLSVLGGAAVLLGIGVVLTGWAARRS